MPWGIQLSYLLWSQSACVLITGARLHCCISDAVRNSLANRGQFGDSIQNRWNLQNAICSLSAASTRMPTSLLINRQTMQGKIRKGNRVLYNDFVCDGCGIGLINARHPREIYAADLVYQTQITSCSFALGLNLYSWSDIVIKTYADSAGLVTEAGVA